MTTLLLTSRFGRDDQLLWQAAIDRGWAVERLRGSRIPAISDDEIAVYAEAFYARLIEQALRLRLLEPSEDWLARLPRQYRQRDIDLITLGEARLLRQPRFLKPPNDKSFKAAVYKTGAALPSEYDENMTVLSAEPVSWVDEFRCFLLDGTVLSLSPYLRSGEPAELQGFEANETELSEAQRFAELVASDPATALPRAVALDVGTIQGRGWAVVEANGAWGSGIYGCKPDSVLDVIRHAVEHR